MSFPVCDQLPRVNIAIPQHLPIEDQNQTPAHQILVLMMLFDIYIDSELGLRQSSHGGGTFDDGLRSGLSDLLRVKSGNVQLCRVRKEEKQKNIKKEKKREKKMRTRE